MKNRTLPKMFKALFVLMALAAGLVSQPALATVTLPFYDGFPSSLTPDGGTLTNVDVNWTNTALIPNIIVGTAYAQSYPGLQTPASGS